MKAAWLALLLPLAVSAAPWSFTAPVDAVDPVSEPVFHHLDGAGRKHLAVSGGQLALVWEDDRDGAPRIYAAVKSLDEHHFAIEFPVSNGEESYEPAVAGLGDGRWMAAWEQDGRIVAAIFDSRGSSEPVQLSSGDGRQVTLAAGGDGAVAAVWAHREGRGQYLVAADLVVSESRVAVAHSGPITPSGSSDYQGFPAAVFAGDGHLIVTWEDRRAGHTRIYGARRNASGRFEDERQLNEHNEPDVTESWLANKGTGAMRVAVAAMPDGGLNAIWLDKRSPGSGYAVWGTSGDDPGRGFGANIRVQDTLGDAVAQWHASVISGPDGFVALWDDARENWSDENETGDVFLSWRTEGGWSEDLMVPGASGPGYQGSPVAVFDLSGQLHLVWIERESLDGHTRLRYLRGTPGG